MSNYNSLKTTIDANIKQNGRQEITGQILNSVLNQMVNTLGAGYQFAGVATLDPATDPGTPDAKVFYIANGKGTYTNFGGIEVTEDEVVVLYWDSSWHKVSTGIASQAKLTELDEQIYKTESQLNGVNETPSDITQNGYAFDDSLVTYYAGDNYRATKIDLTKYPKGSIITFYAYGKCGFRLSDGTIYGLVTYGDSDYNTLQSVEIPSNAKEFCISWAISLHAQELHVTYSGTDEKVENLMMEFQLESSTNRKAVAVSIPINKEITDYTTQNGYGYDANLSLSYMGEQYRASKVNVIGYDGAIINFFGYGYCGFILNDGTKINVSKTANYKSKQGWVIPTNAKEFCISWATSLQSQAISITNNPISEIIHENKIIIPSSEIIDKYLLLRSGELSRSDGFKVTPFIDIRRFAGSTAIIGGTIYGSASVCFYDANRNLIKGIDGSNAESNGVFADQSIQAFELEVPSDAFYVRMSIISIYYVENKIFVGGNLQKSVISETSKEINHYRLTNAPLPTKKILIIGDSITTDITSEDFFHRHAELYPYASYYEVYGGYNKWVYALANRGILPFIIDNSSIHATGFVARYSSASVPDDKNDFINRLKKIENPSSYDMVIVFGGINDWIQSKPMGESGQDVETYFKPAVDEFFSYLVNNFTQARICVCTPLKAYDTGNNYHDGANGVGLFQKDYVNYIKEVAEMYALPLLDLHSFSGFAPSNTTFRNMWCLLKDGVHPNLDYCKKYLAPMIANFIKGLMY